MIPFHQPHHLANGWTPTVIPSPKEQLHTSVAFNFNPQLWETFCLRLILYKIPGRSFSGLRTIVPPSGVSTIYPTFHDAAGAQGLVTGQEKYFICMEEAITFEMPSQLRGLFVTLILDGGPAPKLWNDYKEHLVEDFTRTLDKTDATQEAFRVIDLKIQQLGRSNSQLGLPPPMHRQTEHQGKVASFNRADQKAYADKFEPGFNFGTATSVYSRRSSCQKQTTSTFHD